MKSKIYSIDKIGEVEICKHHNSRRLVIKLKPNGAPKVIIPRLMPFEMGYRFALEKQDWIIQHAELLKARKPITNYIEGQNYPTRFHTISINRHGKQLIEGRRKNADITIFIPENEDIASTKVQQTIKKIITEVLRNEAKMHLIPRLFELAKAHGFNFNKVFIKNLKSRWGSCSSQNNINLNLHLMRLPEYLSDFIILHELCHTVHKNHGKHFHELLNKISGNEKKLNTELKKYSTYI